MYASRIRIPLTKARNRVVFIQVVFTISLPWIMFNNWAIKMRISIMGLFVIRNIVINSINAVVNIAMAEKHIRFTKSLFLLNYIDQEWFRALGV